VLTSPHTDANEVIVTGTFDQASLPIASLILLSYSTHAWHRHFAFHPCLFPSSPHLCLQWASSLRLTRQSDGFEAPPSSSHSETRWHTSSSSMVAGCRCQAYRGLITALSTMCTPLHPSPFYRNLTLPVRGRHIFPNLTRSTSPSLTSRRMVPSCGS
jgi:hypothetical protein